jgi:hypothetical protein
MADYEQQQQRMTDHNFSGPKTDKKDPGLPTMIVFDLDGKSSHERPNFPLKKANEILTHVRESLKNIT